jgi:hypothetical protein
VRHIDIYPQFNCLSPWKISHLHRQWVKSWLVPQCWERRRQPYSTLVQLRLPRYRASPHLLIVREDPMYAPEKGGHPCSPDTRLRRREHDGATVPPPRPTRAIESKRRRSTAYLFGWTASQEQILNVVAGGGLVLELYKASNRDCRIRRRRAAGFQGVRRCLHYLARSLSTPSSSSCVQRDPRAFG